MKFDVAIGNPPYNKPGQGKTPIWDKFITNSISNISSWIIPYGWFVGEMKLAKTVRKHCLDHGLMRVKINPNNTFPSVKVGTCIIWIEQGYDGKIFIAHNHGYHINRIGAYNGIVAVESKLAATIIQKIQTENKLKLRSNSKIPTLHHLSNVSSGKFPFVETLGKNGVSIKFIDKEFKDPTISTIRIVISYLPTAVQPKDIGNIGIIDKNMATLPSYYRYIIVDNLDQANGLATYLNSKLVTFIVRRMRNSRTLDSSQLKYVPYWIPSTPLSNKAIYNHFNLTQEEIDYVEANTK